MCWPDDSRRDLCAVKDAECADSMRREHPDDGERVGEAPIQGVSQNYDRQEKISDKTHFGQTDPVFPCIF